MARSVLIVDDHPAFRSSARLLLEAEGYHVVGEAQDGAEALDAARRLRPDWVLLDVRLPDMSGFDVAATLIAEGPEPVVILTSSHDSSDFGPLVARSGARGFVAKSDLSARALDALLAA